MADKTYEIEVKTTADTEGITSVKDALEETKSEVEEVNDALSDVGSSANDTGDELQSAFEEATEEVERLEEALDEAYLNGDDIEADIIADELAEATAKADELQSQLEAVNSTGTDGAKESVDDLDGSLQQASDSAEGLSTNMGLIDSAVMMDMANQVGALGTQAEGMAQEMNTASISIGQLATNTGIAEPQLVSLINNISNATFPQNEAIAYANALNQMGVEAGQLGESATNMDRINDATGIGYQKVMQLTQGLQAVGVSADRLPESFNAIAFAQANVNGGADTLTTVLKRQAATINEYGLNTDQLVVIMQRLSQQGVQGMKMGSELSKVLKENNGDISAIEQSLGLQAGTLSNATALTGQYEGQLQSLADEEAEHKTLIDQLNAGWEDMQLFLSPVLSPLMSFVGILGQFGQTAMAINSLLTLAETLGILKTATIPATISNYALALSEWAVGSPILIIVALILILIGVLAYLYFNNEQVRGAIDGLGQTILWVGQVIWDTLVNAWNMVIQALQNFWNYLVGLGANITGQVGITSNGVINGIIGFLVFFATFPARVGAILVNALARALGFKGNFVQHMITSASQSVTNFMNYISQLPGQLASELQNMLSLVGEWASTLPQKFWDAGVNAVKNFLSALGIASPGTMQRMMIWEVTEMGKRIPSESQTLLSNVSKLGENIVDEFGDPSLDIGTNLTEGTFGNNSSSTGFNQVNNFYFEDITVDDDDRMQKIADYIQKQLDWNNKTAGRTI